MADEFPVKDVLCQAMDYLSKLGSNLRSRSETLKDKRKDKLNNAIAVQKAADKVLLICELSKKSLANVEAGVRKILDQIDVSQASGNGGKTSSKTDNRKDDKSKYHYFDYKSRKLKMKTKISLKHFKSVKVLARKMSLSMIDKHPVYHECKLYRQRMKDPLKTIIAQVEDHALTKEKESTKENSQSICKAVESDSYAGSKNKLIYTDSEDSDTQQKKELNDNNRKANDDEKKMDNSHKEPEPKKKKNNHNHDNNVSNDEDMIQINKKADKDKAESDLEKSSENDCLASDKKPMIKCVSICKLLKPDMVKKDITKSSDPPKKTKEFDVNKKNEMLQTAKKHKDKLLAVKRREVSAFKPKEFSIHITRLPELSKEFLCACDIKRVIKDSKTIYEITDNKSESSSDHIISKKKHRRSKQTSNDSNSEDQQLIAEANKVKNSLLFESDSDSFSKSNNKESETTVDRIKNALLDSDSDKNVNVDISNNPTNKPKKSSENKKSKNDELNSGESYRNTIHQENAAKNDLLCKSDSDDNCEKVSKSSLEDEKGPNKSCNEDEAKNDSENVNSLQESLLKTPEKQKNAKNSLLNDSSNDETKTPLNQRMSATPQSKKKRIRESMQAKNDLLRYSSGSETEDEKLRNTLNNIKKSLLEGLSDDESKLKPNKHCSSSKDSSSCSEDMAVKVKKKKSNKSNPVKKKKRRRIVVESDSEEGKEKGSSSDDDISSPSSSKMVRSKSKPGSSLSTDVQDPNDKDIDGLTNLKTLNASRRRNSDATDDETETSNSTAKSKMAAKPISVIGEEILKAESSSDAITDDGGVGDEDEDLPSVSISGFNGGLQHLVKEDLLEDSDSSVSNKEEKHEDSDEGRQLSSKRRKPNAIASSDSEAGTTQKKEKDDDVRVSDFEDSDDSDITKRTKRKKKGSDSDVSGGSSESNKQKKRRRIKALDDSEGSGSDSDNDGKNKHGRKNIRRVMGKSQLEEATKKAAREEKERVARIAERQKMYNNLQFDESGKPDEVILDKVVLDFDPETKEPLIAVDRGLVKKLKPHQANGIKFMWDACFESVKRIKKAKGSGCILAHCMGLGKTLQVVALTHTLLAHGSLTKVDRVLVVCPLSTVLNWVNEFTMWLRHAERENDINVYELSRYKQNSDRAFQLSQWYEHGGVCVLGYEMFRNLSADNNKKFKKKMLKNFQEALVDPGPDLVVCDEGHLLKNEKTSLSQSMNKVRTLRRIVLTGTPLQNNLKEYYCMVQFVKPNLLGKYNEYLNRFVNPITNGQYTDSTEHDIKIMKRRSHVLHKMLDGAVQRRDYGVLAPFLPPKHEYVLFITLTDVQVKLYQHYLDNYSRRPLPGKSSGFLFPDFQSLQRIWTHPLVLKYNSDRYEIMQQKKRDKEEEEDSEGSLVDFIDDDSTPAESSSEESSGGFSDMSDDSRKKSKKKSSKKSKTKDKDPGGSRRRGTRANPIDLDLEEEKDDDILEVKNENPTEWWIKMVEEEELEDMRNSHKLVLLFDILRQCEAIGDKLLVFSQSLYSLDLIEHFLGKVDEAAQEGRIDEKLGCHVGSWSQGIDYFRLDGSTSCENRSIWCKNFNREDNPRARLFLISTRAGGLGINLVAANRVVIFDVSWNPSHDVQSIFRVYRFGQKKPCYVYRFLAMGTMEEKIYERQVTKQAISKRVIDEQQIDRHYAENDLAELYKFEAVPPSPRPLPPLPKDRLFAEMLREHDKQIYRYHEHDSLLENKEEETLSEEERKAAWEDFENEKNRPPPAPFPSPWQMNGMMPNMLAQQQQQLAYAALAAMLRKDMPNVNDNQIRDMLPMLYNANPGLMQKMGEILKYSQHMNMAPGMMGQPGMNPASGAALGMAPMGSSSGLQYEPPWQRQQQQQQQLRLQQLMAQQQNMGAAAKFYAGGLGSRDPVAMALQQQRAREIMVGGGGGGAAARPRGRPPLQPRAPPPAGDVVNLDSD